MKTNFPSLVVGFTLGALVSGGLVGTAMAYQEHMHLALDKLQMAKNQLNMAEHDKDGHREKAIEDVDAAIGEVQAGIQAGR